MTPKVYPSLFSEDEFLIAVIPIIEIPNTTKISPKIWCLYNYLFKKATDIIATITITPPLNIYY